MNKLLTKIANSKKAQLSMIYGGIIFEMIGSLFIMYGSYYRGVKNGVDAIDEYYYLKEKDDYEKKCRDQGCCKDGL